jgi:hypothetical protein
VVYFGSSLFKILRLLIIAIFSIHLFACIFYRVKETSALSPDDVTEFYISRNAADDVSLSEYALLRLFTVFLFVFLQTNAGVAPDCGRAFPINM